MKTYDPISSIYKLSNIEFAYQVIKFQNADLWS